MHVNRVSYCCSVEILTVCYIYIWCGEQVYILVQGCMYGCDS